MMIRSSVLLSVVSGFVVQRSPGHVRLVRMFRSALPAHIEEAKKLVEAGEATLVDVREPNEWNEGHFASAVNVPFLSQLAEGNVPESLLSSVKPVVIHCKMGGRAAKASEVLASKGVSTILLSETFEDLCSFEFDNLTKES